MLTTVLGDRSAWRDLYAAADPSTRADVTQLAGRLLDVVDAEVAMALDLPYAELKARLDADVWVLAQGADKLQYTDDGHDVFEALARMVAALALQPGGLTFAAHHWCVLHRLCPSADRIIVTGGS